MKDPRSALGARLRPGRPVATLTFIGLCVVSFLLQLTIGWEGWTVRFLFVPFLGEVEPYRFITSAFLHSTSITHILFNMYALWITGPFLEAMLGRARFIALYLLSAVGGSVAVLLFADPTTVGWVTPVLGASGAVFGLFGALAVVLRRLDRDSGQILVLLAINFAISFVIPNISWQGHVGGLVVGALMGLGFAHSPKDKRGLYGVIIPVATAIILFVITSMKYATL